MQGWSHLQRLPHVCFTAHRALWMLLPAPQCRSRPGQAQYMQTRPRRSMHACYSGAPDVSTYAVLKCSALGQGNDMLSVCCCAAGVRARAGN